ncbi:MAG: hypothetical protein D6743_13900, partial [Calditrichaeota bacterium]
MLDLPFETSFIIILASISLALAVLTLLLMVIRGLVRTARRLARKELRYVSVSRNVFRFGLTFLWIAGSMAVLFLAAFIQSYHAFTREELVAEVRCVPLSDDGASMQLELTPVYAGKRGMPRTFILNGDQWALEGNILKWDDWLNFAGLHTMYKLTRVRGRYESYLDEVNQPPSVYSLVEREDDPRWRWLYKYGHRLRFVSAVYGNTVYTYPSEKYTYEIYVTTSGFIARVR